VAAALPAATITMILIISLSGLSPGNFLFFIFLIEEAT